ncbi:glycosyltransferase [Flavobacterium sp. Sr18]|uniref:glycosyltransferase family 4 protein n=1 Tax=Flavobacterium sp. Sr18 TaxID=935222 RepID=UPI0013E47A06|nr:glycosyltransferase [Flavobacterium sp. Sr18]QIH40029.1 glycosyltransferase [Flavobacterium sp. Sr18]
MTKTILASCYAVNPYKGSENGMGWNFVYQIARYNKVIAITRENNKEMIDLYMSQNQDVVFENITFLYFDLPYWMRFWKKGGRGAMFYYYLWQKGIVSFIKKQNVHFDIAHNVNFHNDWTPSSLWKLNKPMVWGPIGHHPEIPKQYLNPYSVKYFLQDRATWLVKNCFWKLSFSLHKTKKKSNHILGMNSGVATALKISTEPFSILPSVATEDNFSGNNIPKEGFDIISVGRFVPLKGFDLTLLSFASFINSLEPEDRNYCKLTLIGTGPEKDFYKTIIAQNHIEPYVEIIEWIDRSELMKCYEKSSVFLFPSHEGAGMVVAEALSFGLPVICLDNEGPGEFINSKCGFTASQIAYNGTVLELKEALSKLYLDKNLLHQMSLDARKHYLNNFTWDSRGDYLQKIYNTL